MGYYTNRISAATKPDVENYIHISIPLFIRLMELAKEEVDVDRDLHIITEALIKVSGEDPATMDDYAGIVQALLDAPTPDLTEQYHTLVINRNRKNAG